MYSIGSSGYSDTGGTYCRTGFNCELGMSRIAGEYPGMSQTPTPPLTITFPQNLTPNPIPGHPIDGNPGHLSLRAFISN